MAMTSIIGWIDSLISSKSRVWAACFLQLLSSLMSEDFDSRHVFSVYINVGPPAIFLTSYRQVHTPTHHFFLAFELEVKFSHADRRVPIK